MQWCWYLASVSFVVIISSVSASAFAIIPSLIVARHRPMSSTSSCNSKRSNDKMITIDSHDDSHDADRHHQQRGEQSVDSKHSVKGANQKHLSHIDDDSDSDGVFEAMRQKLKQPVARTTAQKRRLNHLLDNNDGSDDDFEVMRQKLREMQNSKVREMERRRSDTAADTLARRGWEGALATQRLLLIT